MTEDGRRTSDDRGQKSEVRGQMTEGRRRTSAAFAEATPKAFASALRRAREDGGQKANDE
jgi:hypothetical protein